MTAPKIVALVGVPGSGKTLVARCMIAAGFHRVRFADAAREMLVAGFGCTPHEIDGDQRDTPQRRFGGHTVKSVMHALTHDFGRRQIHSDIWVNEWRRRTAKLDGFVLTDDLQRPNEAAAIRDAGGIIVRITRPNYTAASEAVVQRLAKIGHDLELLNDGPDQLIKVAEQFLAGLDQALASKAA